MNTKETRKSNFERYYRALKAIGKNPIAQKSSNNRDSNVLAFESSNTFLDIARLTLELEEYDEYILSHTMCVYGNIVLFGSIVFDATQAKAIDVEIEKENNKKKSELLFSLIGGEDSYLGLNTLEYLYDEATRLSALNLFYYLHSKSLSTIEAIIELVNDLEA